MRAVTDPERARGYAAAHVADSGLWPLLERMAAEIERLRAQLAACTPPEAIGTAYDS